MMDFNVCVCVFAMTNSQQHSINSPQIKTDETVKISNAIELEKATNNTVFLPCLLF